MPLFTFAKEQHEESFLYTFLGNRQKNKIKAFKVLSLNFFLASNFMIMALINNLHSSTPTVSNRESANICYRHKMLNKGEHRLFPQEVDHNFHTV